MINLSKHATHMGWNDVALYGEFYQGLTECIKDQLLLLYCSQMFQQFKANALKCDTRYWDARARRPHPLVRLGNPPSPPHQKNWATPEPCLPTHQSQLTPTLVSGWMESSP